MIKRSICTQGTRRPRATPFGFLRLFHHRVCWLGTRGVFPPLPPPPPSLPRDRPPVLPPFLPLFCSRLPLGSMRGTILKTLKLQPKSSAKNQNINQVLQCVSLRGGLLNFGRARVSLWWCCRQDRCSHFSFLSTGVFTIFQFRDLNRGQVCIGAAAGQFSTTHP